MPQELMFNELCIRHEEIRLQKSLDNAKHWLIQFSELLSLLSKHKNIKHLRVPISFKRAYLVKNYTLGRLLNDQEFLLEKKHKNRIKEFIDKGKYLEDIKEITDDNGVFQHHKDLYMFSHTDSEEYCRGFGAAHLLEALSVSIDTEEIHWDCESIRIEKHHNSGDSNIEVSHACKKDHLNLPERTFEPNEKHDIVVENKTIAKMDLTDKEAQAVLDFAVQPNQETRFFGYSCKTKRFYVFPQHREGLYHGYPVELKEIHSRKQVLRLLNDLGVINNAIKKGAMKGT